MQKISSTYRQGDRGLELLTSVCCLQIWPQPYLLVIDQAVVPLQLGLFADKKHRQIEVVHYQRILKAPSQNSYPCVFDVDKRT